MPVNRYRAALACAVVMVMVHARPADGQHEQHAAADTSRAAAAMWMADLGAGWRLLGMGQAFPMLTIGAPGRDGSPLRETEAYLTQAAVMANLESPGSRFVLRTTLNLEGLTQEDGELTFGGWGEGFIDRRHPHTLLHELMLSVNLGRASVSAGKGFAPFGTDDPMSRPAPKYPTNHHLSQVLERWTVNGVLLVGDWSVEAGLFGGAEPEDPWDMSNIESFGDSWSARLAKRWGPGHGPAAAWETSVSHAYIVEEHDGAEEATRLWNAALRHDGTWGAARLYTLLEYSRSEPDHGQGFYSLLSEGRVTLGRHRPWARVELATRPEYPREGAAGTNGFFRYDHDAGPIGATRWLIANVGYGYAAVQGAVSIRPFVDVQFHRVRHERGPAELEPETLFGTGSFWTFSVGARVLLGGEPMRMGAYGVLDAMTAMHGASPMHSGPVEHDGHRPDAPDPH